MEFNEKLQELRKQKGMTQEELAEALWVSRAAVSKWESGRGYPSIDSLKEISRFFSVSIDTLLSGDQILTIAEEDRKQTEARCLDLIFGLLDLSAASFLFLPIFGQQTAGGLAEVSLLRLTGLAPYLRAAYLIPVIGLILLGILTLALQNVRNPLWLRVKRRLSLVLSGIGTFLFILSPQPYAAAFLFLLLLIKALLLSKKQ